MSHRTAFTALTLVLAACAPRPSQIVVTHASAVATPAGAAAYFTVRNSGGADRLLSVEAPGVGAATIHETTMDGGVMRMRPAGPIDIPANGSVEFKRGGYHVMIEQLAKPHAEGDTLHLTLKFERHGPVPIEAPVAAPGPAMEGM